MKNLIFYSFLFFLIGLANTSSAVSFNYNSKTITADKATNLNKSKFKKAKKGNKLFKNFHKKIKNHRFLKSLFKGSKIDELDTIYFAILTLLIGIGALIFLLLAQLSGASLGLIILYWILAVLLGVASIWLGLFTWKESAYSEYKAATRWIASIGMLLGGLIAGAVLEPLLVWF